MRSYSVMGIGILSCGVLALSMIYVNRSILNGAGDTSFALFNGTVEIVGRIGFAWLYTSVLPDRAGRAVADRRLKLDSDRAGMSGQISVRCLEEKG